MKLPVLLVLLAAVFGLAAPAAAHENGKANPRIAAGVSGAGGLERRISVVVTDADSGRAVAGAIVEAYAEMSGPHLMRTAPWRLVERRPGRYGARVTFPMPARWRIVISVRGAEVVPAEASLTSLVTRSQAAGPTGTPAAALPTRLEDELTRRDLASLAALWLHALAALGWIGGVVVMALALSADPGILVAGARRRLRDAYLSWGAWLHWSLVPVVVLTGIYNMLTVTPFPLAWRPDDLRRLGDIPYGPLYEAILVVKLGLFFALLVTGTRMLTRTLALEYMDTHRKAAGPARRLASALGPPGVVYLACVPLIVAAAAALRYVHVLSHVASVLAER